MTASIASSLALLGAIAIPVIVEWKLIDRLGDGSDHIWNILKRILLAVLILWIWSYAVSSATLGSLQNPIAAPLQMTVLSSIIAIPVSIVGYLVGRWRS